MKNCYTYLRKTVSVIAIVAITLFMISKITYLLEDKSSYKNYASFMTGDSEYDVLFVGSSHVRYAFYPMELWKDHGITSYNLAGDANTLPVDYWQLRQAFKYHVPKVVVLDAYDNTPGKIVGGWEFVHYATNVFPISLDKIRMVMDLARNPEWKDSNGELTSRRWDLFFKLAEYHERWDKLIVPDYSSKKDFVEESEVRKGSKPLPEIVDREQKVYPEVIDAEYDDIAKEYLEKTIDLCNEYGCKVILINTGYDCNDDAKLFADSVPEIADKYGIEYYDFTAMDLISFDSDLQTTGWNTHVNASGGQKLTDFIGDKLAGDYHLDDHREDTSYQKWHKDFDRYQEYWDKQLVESNTLDQWLEFSYGTDYSVTIDVNNVDALQEGHAVSMMKNLGIDVDKVTAGSRIVIEPGQNVRYENVTGSVEGNVIVSAFDGNRQRTIDEKTF